MEITEFTVKALLFGVPGIIAYLVSDKLLVRNQKEPVITFITIFLYSFICYTILAAHYYWFWNLDFKHVFRQISASKSTGEEQTLILSGSLIGLILAYIIGFFFRYSIFNKIGQTLRTTDRFGDIDVWHYFNNSPLEDKNDGYVYIRDGKTNFTYYGSIRQYSDSGTDRELILSNVSVYESSSGDFLYDVEHIYLSRNRDEITIEVPLKKELPAPAQDSAIESKAVEVSDKSQRGIGR